MGSMRLGSPKTTPAAVAAAGTRANKDNILATSKTKPRPPLTDTNNDNNSSSSGNSNNKPTRTRTVWSTAKERIIRAGRSPAKITPHITTISTPRSNNTSGNTAALRPLLPPPLTPLPLTPPLSLTQAPPRPARSPPPPLILLHTTNPSADDTTPPITTAHHHPRPQSRPRPRPTPLPLAATRAPFKLRDQNVAPVFAPVLKENRKMGYESSLNPPTTSNRPQMPSLSATAARGINRTPLTPKIAAASRPSQPQTPSLTAASIATTTTPLARRTQQRPVSTISAAGSSRTVYDDPNTTSAASFSPHLHSNVTPRSGSRQSRVDSANSTPNGTPSHDRFDFPLSSPLNQGDSSRRPLVTFSAVSPEKNMFSGRDPPNSRDSKFFHASDAKTTRPTSASKTTSPNNSTFFYANGNGIASKAPSPATLSPPLSPALNKSQENVSSKFMYANGAPELRPTPPPVMSRGSGSTVSTTSKAPTVRSTVVSQRPASPSKLPLHSPSYRNSTGPSTTTNTTSTASAARVQISPPPPLVPSTPGLRRPGTATSRSSCHSRSGSLVKAEFASEPLRPISSPTLGLFPPANLSPMNPPPLTLASIIQAAEEFTEHENDTSPDDQSVLQSPTKSTVSSADPVTELIANARRERKVQDLQIRNASLEAINRTLERQLRKQTAELRRYRRLSRSGRLSLASTTMSSRVPSGGLSELELESLGLSDLSEEEISMADFEDESFSDTDSTSSGLSATVLAERDAKHRHRDEERLQLDLSKHQQILVDSQKINQSIKRCIEWSDGLIKDGKKALEYKVRVSDIQLGGRVLDPLDEEEENIRPLSSDETAAIDVKPMEEVPEPPTSWGIEPQDRDSGIELPRDGG